MSETTAKHTPGPWRTDLGWGQVGDARNRVILCEGGNWEITREEMNANLLLCAAAPEMLAVARMIHQQDWSSLYAYVVGHGCEPEWKGMPAPSDLASGEEFTASGDHLSDGRYVLTNRTRLIEAALGHAIAAAEGTK